MESYEEARNSYFHDDLKRRTRLISQFPTLEQAAQSFVEELYSDFRSSVLVRLYTTIPYEKLTPSTRAFAEQIAQANGVADQIRDDTLVLCLMGTKGKRPEWSDRRRSKSHQAIPLVSRRFVQTIPMIARLLNEFGIGTDWIDQADKTSIITSTFPMRRHSAIMPTAWSSPLPTSSPSTTCKPCLASAAPTPTVISARSSFSFPRGSIVR
jgi:hypothetical protein